MKQTTIILITGHPATGKTTLSQFLAQKLELPLIVRDQLKETLADTLGWSDDEWSLKLGAATWELLYDLVETLLQGKVSHIVESNFSPIHATPRWQQLCGRYPVNIIQLRCEADPDIVIARFHDRVAEGKRHPIHRYGTDTTGYRAMLAQGHIGWIEVPGERISVDTGRTDPIAYDTLAVQLRKLINQQG